MPKKKPAKAKEEPFGMGGSDQPTDEEVEKKAEEKGEEGCEFC